MVEIDPDTETYFEVASPNSMIPVRLTKEYLTNEIVELLQ